MTSWLDKSREIAVVALAVLGAALALALIGLIIWRAVDEIRYLRRQRIIARYRPLIDALLTPKGEAGAVERLVAAPRRHRDLLSDLLLGALRLTTGDVVPRLGDAAAALGLVDRWRGQLDDRRWWVRAAAVRALGLVRDMSSSDRLEAALDEVHEEVRAAAVDALGRIGDPMCAPALLARLRDESKHQRARVVEALRALGPSIVPVLIAHATEESCNTATTVDILGVVGGTAAVDSLLAWSGNDDILIRTAALRALGSIGLDDRSFFFALRALDDSDAEVRGMAARGLGRSGMQAAVPYLASHLDDEWVVAAHCATGLRRLGRAGASALEERAKTTGQGGELARQMLWELNSQQSGAVA
jgi:HEAT repeat protein